MTFDPVSKPAHYNLGGIECLDAMEASMSEIEFDGYLKGNAFKYLWRYRHKGKAAEDLGKAMFYLARLAERVRAREDAKKVEDAAARLKLRAIVDAVPQAAVLPNGITGFGYQGDLT